MDSRRRLGPGYMLVEDMGSLNLARWGGKGRARFENFTCRPYPLLSKVRAVILGSVPGTCTFVCVYILCNPRLILRGCDGDGNI